MHNLIDANNDTMHMQIHKKQVSCSQHVDVQDVEVQENTRADAPSRGRALVSAGVAGNHRGSLVH